MNKQSKTEQALPVGWSNRQKGTKMDYMYHIDKCDAVRSQYYGMWEVQQCECVEYGLVPVIGTVFRAKTRKECISYAKENNLNVTFIGTGRIVKGHKW